MYGEESEEFASACTRLHEALCLAVAYEIGPRSCLLCALVSPDHCEIYKRIHYGHVMASQTLRNRYIKLSRLLELLRLLFGLEFEVDVCPTILLRLCLKADVETLNRKEPISII